MPRLAAALILAGVALAALRRRALVGHWSDCAVYSEPAFPAGPCDCGGFPLSRTVH